MKTLREDLNSLIDELTDAMHNHYEQANTIEEHTGRHDTRVRGTAEGYGAIINTLKDILKNHPE